MIRISMTALVLAAAVVAALPASAADVSGAWTLTGDVVGNPLNMKCTFTQDGAKVTGSCAGDQGSVPTTGNVEKDQVTFGNTVQSYDITYTGTLDATGTSMKGDIAVAGVTGTFTATKDAAPGPAAAKETATQATDVAGTWHIVGDVVGNPIDMKCTLKRDGTALSGTCTYQGLGDSPTKGSVEGDKVTLENIVQREQTYDLTYSGVVDSAGASMKGDIAVAGVNGTFSGTKDK